MPTEISSRDAKDRFGISTLHHLMENSERRFRLRSIDGTAYIRTEAGASGNWQESHYHKHVQETYIVQSGWMGFAELIDKKLTVRIVETGDVITTRPEIVHNVYLPSQAVIHTVKHGAADGDDRKTDGDAPAFNIATKSLGELEIRALAMRPASRLEYSEGYRHFDLLIWQAPAWSAAIFALSIQSVIEVFKGGGSTGSMRWTGWLIVLLAMTLLTFSVVLYRFRSHQRPLKPFSNTPVWRSASSWTQSLISLQSMVLLGLGLVLLDMQMVWVVSICSIGWLLLVVVLERDVRRSVIKPH